MSNLQSIINDVFAIYNKSSIFAGDPNRENFENSIEGVRNLFSRYACMDFAYATYLLNGWKMYQLDFFSEDCEDYAPYHIVVKKPESELYYDINGLSNIGDLVKLYDAEMEYVSVYEIEPTPFLITNEKEISVIIELSKMMIEEI